MTLASQISSASLPLELNHADRPVVAVPIAKRLLEFSEELLAAIRIIEVQLGGVWEDIEHQLERAQADRANPVKHHRLIRELAPSFAEETVQIQDDGGDCGRVTCC